MGRSKIINRIEITPQIKELQELAKTASFIGYSVNVDISQDLVTINGYIKLSYDQAKLYLIKTIEEAKHSEGSNNYPDQAQLAREEREKAKQRKKNRKPGTPPELKDLVRRAKRIYKKTIVKTSNSATATEKSYSYLDRKSANQIDHDKAKQIVDQYILKLQRQRYDN